MDINKLKLDYGLDFRVQEPLASHTTYRIGGPAEYYVEVKNETGLRQAIQAALDNQLAYFILGNGSNVLVSDDGFPGLVIRLIEGSSQTMETGIKVFAGNAWPKLVRQTIAAGFEGLEFSANIPGAVGGMIRGNAGAYGKGVGDFVKAVEALIINGTEVSLKIYNQAECEFAYRESLFKKNPQIIIANVTFELPRATREPETLLREIAEENATRCAKQPLRYPSAGCSFKNLEYSEAFAQYREWASNGKIAAGKFIDVAGLKGKSIGGAKISEEHANFIINFDGTATASDVIQLISLVKMTVRDQFGVELEEEIQYVGF